VGHVLLQMRTAEAAHAEAAVQELMQALDVSRSTLEARATELSSGESAAAARTEDLNRREAHLERNATALADLEATLGTLSSSASEKAAAEADVLADLQNTIENQRSAVRHGSAEVSKSALQVCS
jgi:chromosome segregation ATPase